MANKYFDPDGLSRVGNMELVARQVVEGFLTGRHRSPYHGFSVEYLDHRAYTPGDEIHDIDWRILARTDKYFVKLFEDETNLRAYILLDCSRSMAYPLAGRASDGGLSAIGPSLARPANRSGTLSKLEYGCFLAAALSYLMLHQNDAVGLVTFDSTVRQFLAPRARPTQFRRILDLLEPVAGDGDTDLGTILHQVAERIRRRGLVILISDLIDNEANIASGLQHFRHDHHEVLVFQVMDDDELSFPFDRTTRFKDIEGTGRVVANPKSLRPRYLERLQAFLNNVQSACYERGISYNLANTKQPYDQFLAAYLEKRARLG